MSEANFSHRLFRHLGNSRHLGFLVLVLVLHFVLIACDSTPVEEESESLQQTETAKPDDPVVVNTDDQDPPEISLNVGAYPTGIVMDTSPVVNFTSDEKGTVYITGNDGGSCPAKIFTTEVSAGANNCVELHSSNSTARSIVDMEGGIYDCRLVLIDQGGNQDYVNLSFTIVSPTSQAGDLLNQLQDNMSGTNSTVDSTCSSTSSRLSSSRTALSSSNGNSCVGCEMTPAQSSKVLAKVAEALRNQGMLNSSNLLNLMPKIVELVQKNLKEAELDQNGDQITRVVKNMLGTLISKMNGKEAFMSPSSAEPGLTVQTTLLK